VTIAVQEESNMSDVPRRSRRHLKGAAAAATLVLPFGLAACGSSDSGSSSSAAGSGGGSSTIKIGDLESLSGAGASVGVPEGNSVKLAADKINAAGGIKAGDKTYKIKIVQEDDKSDPTAGVTAVQKMLSSEGLHYIVGTTSSAVAAAYVPVIKDRDDVVSVVVSAALSGITDNPQIYRPRVTNAQYTDATVKYLTGLGSVKSIATLTDKEHAGFVGELPRLVSLLKAQGIATVAQESYTFGDTSFGSQISAMLRKNPQLLNIRGYPGDVARAIKQAREQGYKGPIVTNSGTTAGEVKDAQAASAMTNVIDIFAPLPSDQIKLNINPAPSKTFLADYKAKYNSDPAGTSASAYDGLRILAAAIGKAGGPDDVAKVRSALDALTVTDVPDLVSSFKPQAGDRIFKERQSYFTVTGREWKNGDWQATTAL
jgi:branched-chain amino acid transport system substrate-binding protein